MVQAKGAEPGASRRTTTLPSSSLKLRIASALVMAPLALAATWAGPPFFPMLVGLGAAGMGWEWARLTGISAKWGQGAIIATAVACAFAAALGTAAVGIAIAVIGAFVVWRVAIAIGAPAPRWAALGTLWIALPGVAIIWVDAAPQGRAAVLWLFAVVWASDIGAYAAGRAIGGPRLAPALSPNKTWAGAVGGLIVAGLLGYGVAQLVHGSTAMIVPASLALSVAAELGDLAESFAKRKFGVKDTGGIIPGHGGLLDRLDSLLTAAVVQGLMLLFGAGLGVDLLG